MSRLFIELYLDEDVDVLVAELLRARGFVVLATCKAGQLGSDDASQLADAVSQQKTFSRITARILRRWPRATSRRDKPITVSSLQSVMIHMNWCAVYWQFSIR